MNTYYIRVLIDPTGALRGINAIKGALQGVEGTASRLGSIFKTLFAVSIASRIVGGVIKLGDAYADLENKVRQASGKNDLLVTSMDKVFKAANRARTDVAAFGKTVLAISGATANMNLGFDASVRMTETLSKMMKLSGSSTEEAKSATLQFGQALRKGKLNGDEMRSVMENSIELQKALAKSLHGSTDELLSQSKAGKITRAVMVDALVKGAADVDKRFAEMTLKVSDAWTVLHNKAIEFAGSLNIAGVLGPALMFVGDHFDTLAKIALVAAQVIGTYFVRQGIMMAIRGLGFLAAAALTNPFTAIMYAITATVALLRVFASDVKVSTDSIATIGDVFSVVVGDIITAAKEVGRWIGGVAEAAAAAFGEMVDLSDVSFKDIVMFFARFADLIINIAVFLKETVADGFKEMALSAAEGLIDVYIKAKNFADKVWNGSDAEGIGKPQEMGWKDFGYSALHDDWTSDGFGKGFRDRETETQNNTVALSGIRDLGEEAIKMSDAQWDAYRKAALVQLAETQKDLLGAGNGLTALFSVGEIRKGLAMSREEVIARGMAATNLLPNQGQGYSNSGKTDMNPFAGATDDFRAGAKKRWDKMTEIQHKEVSEYFENVFTRAEAAHGKSKPKPKWGMGEFGGKAVEPPDTAAERLAKSMQLKLDALLSKTFPAQKASIELGKDQDVVNWGVKHHKITANEGLKVMQQRREELKDLIDPYAALIREAEKDILATENLNGVYATHLKVKEQLNKLNLQGVDITNKQVFALQRVADLEVGLSDDQNRKKGMLDSAKIISGDQQRVEALTQAKLTAKSPADFDQKASAIDDTQFFAKKLTIQDEYAQGLQAIVQIGQTWTDQGMAQNQVLANQAVLLDDLNTKYGVLTDKQQSVVEGLKDGWNQVFHDFGSTAKQVAGMVSDTFGSLVDGIAGLVASGAQSWGEFLTKAHEAMDSFVLGFLEGMAKIATQRLIWEIMSLITPGGIATTTAVGAVAHNSLGLPHLADGGTFKVNGPSGRDQVFTPLMLTDGEHVTVTPRGEPPPGHAGGGSTVIVVRNEREAALAVMQSPAGRRIQVRNVGYDEAYLRAIQSRG